MPPKQVAAGASRLHELTAEYERTPPAVRIGLHAVLGDRAAATGMRETLGAFYGLTEEEIAGASLAGCPCRVAERAPSRRSRAR